MTEGPLFILAGNGPYENRGCEAIIRGTVKILREYFKDPKFLCFTHFDDENQYRAQCSRETDNAIVHLNSYGVCKREVMHNFWRPDIWRFVFDYFFRPQKLKYRVYREMLPYLDDASTVLSVGGDNYTLDYGIPTLYTGLDDIVLERGKPIILWGASVGPFDKLPEYERYMRNHLKRVTGIFARESATIEYLKSIGVTKNVCPVADPAFLMEPVKHVGIEDRIPIDEESIGINLSPLMAKYITNGDLEQWARMAASIVAKVAKITDMYIYLVPHVTSRHSNDYAFMQEMLSFIQNKNRNRKNNIILVPPIYNSAETKWVISQMVLFAGARTHSTIAALSTGVPTLSFAYSLKSQGINRDIFGHETYILYPHQLNVDATIRKITSMLEEADNIRRELAKKIPKVKRLALCAGEYLKRLS